MCQHQPSCPSAAVPGHSAARVVAAHPEQGWSLLCNGVVLFDDTGELLPDGHVVAPQAAAVCPAHSAPVPAGQGCDIAARLPAQPGLPARPGLERQWRRDLRLTPRPQARTPVAC